MSQIVASFVPTYLVKDIAPRKPHRRSAPSRRPFWITLGVAALLAGALGISRYEAPPEMPARVVLEVDGLT